MRDLLRRAGVKIGQVAALLVAVMLTFAACASDSKQKVEVRPGASSENSISLPDVSITTSPTDQTTIVPSTTSGPPAPTGGSPIDPNIYISPSDYDKIAHVGTVLLPTWLPSWASSATPVVITVLPQQPTFFEIAWDIPDGSDPITNTAGGGVRIDVTRETYKNDVPPPPLPPRTIAGTDRTYHTDYDGNCPPTDTIIDGPVLVWESGGFAYSVTMQPWPMCVAGFSIQNAVAFADSLVHCGVTVDALACEAKAT